MKKLLILLFTIIYSTLFSQVLNEKALHIEALTTIEKAADFYHSISTHGGYVHFYSLDLKHRWGEKKADANTIEVQEPGTPAIGMLFLNAYDITGNKKYLQYAKDAAYALIEGQNKYGGWNHTINFAKPDKKPVVSLDDYQTQGAANFLLELKKNYSDEKIDAGAKKAIKAITNAQLKNGGFPQIFPDVGSYHYEATFNDGCITDCMNVIAKAYQIYSDSTYLRTFIKGADFFLKSIYSEKQPGWAMQYDNQIKPAWARTFEPASLTPVVTLRNCFTLMNAFLITGKQKYLKSIEPALEWVKSTRLPNGKFPRFVEMETNKPLYYDRGRKRVNSVAELSEERSRNYGYEQNLDNMITAVEERYSVIGENAEIDLTRSEHWRNKSMPAGSKLVKAVEEIISDQDSLGRWTSDILKLKKAKFADDWLQNLHLKKLLSSSVFISNMEVLLAYIKSQKN